MGPLTERFVFWAVMLFIAYFSWLGFLSYNDAGFYFKSIVTRWAVAMQAGETKFDLKSTKLNLPVPWEGIEAPLTFLTQSACDLNLLPSLEGAVAVVNDGNCSLDTKAKNLQKLGALAAVFVSDDTRDEQWRFEIPSVTVPLSGLEELKRINLVEIIRTPDFQLLDDDHMGLWGFIVLVVVVQLAIVSLVCLLLYLLSCRLKNRADAKMQEYKPLALDDMKIGSKEM